MTAAILLRRNLGYFRTTHAWVIAGTFLAAATLTGALLVGDSLRASLRQLTTRRLGTARTVVQSSPRLFRADLAQRLSNKLSAPTAAVLSLRGVAERPEPKNAVSAQIFGVTEEFWQLAPSPWSGPAWSDDGVVINRAAAQHLGIKAGDALVLRMPPTNVMPYDTTFSADTPTAPSLRATVQSVIDNGQFGSFSLKNSHATEPAVFLPHQRLATRIERPERANLVVVGETADTSSNAATVQAGLRAVFRLEDAELELNTIEEANLFQLESRRVFLEDKTEAVAKQAGEEAFSLLTYFVHGMHRDNAEKEAPFIFVTATDAPPITDKVKDGEIVITEWLANDLDVNRGQLLGMNYFNPVRGETELAARSRTVIVRDIVPMDAKGVDRRLTPPLPGLVDVQDCRNWKPGFPLDLDRVGAKDEAYWDEYGPTPRAFATLAFGRSMWHNRFGNTTAVRFPAAQNDEAQLRAQLTARLDPAALGIRVRPVYAEGVEAGNNAVNFGQLFLGMSFFLIVSSLLLAGLLFLFGIEQRMPQIGILRTLGFTAGQTARMLFVEGAALALAGVIPGTLAGIGFNLLLLLGLGTIWSEAIGGVSLVSQVRWETLAIGGGIALAFSLLVLGLVCRKRVQMRTLNLQQHIWGEPNRLMRRSPLPYVIVALLLAAIAAVLCATGLVPLNGRGASLVSFGCGALVLGAGLLLGYAHLIRSSRRHYGTNIRIRRMGIRNNGRHPRRAAATTLMLACGLFLVLIVGTNRRSPGADKGRPSGGTGGFDLLGETAVPIRIDLNNPEKLKALGVDSVVAKNTYIVPFASSGGDQANCLNLHRVDQPRLLGVSPDALAERNSFRFVRALPPVQPHMTDGEEAAAENAPADKQPAPPIAAEEAPSWRWLNANYGPNIIPAVADQSVIRWGLHKKVGDLIEYTDAAGNPLKVKLIAALEDSVLQGNIIVSREALLKAYPHASGASVLLVDAPTDHTAELRTALIGSLAEHGLHLEDTTDRLSAFLEVENTYLAIFLALGGLGLLVGTGGLAVLVARNVSERVRELAVLRALGFTRGQLRRMLFWEHAYLIGWATVVAAVAVGAGMAMPIIQSGNALPWREATGVVAAVLVTSLAWVWWAGARNTRTNLLSALRHE